jgi:hypothetical protein
VKLAFDSSSGRVFAAAAVEALQIFASVSKYQRDPTSCLGAGGARRGMLWYFRTKSSRCCGVGYGAGDGDAGIATATQDAALSGLGGGEESALSCRHSSDEDTVSVSERF